MTDWWTYGQTLGYAQSIIVRSSSDREAIVKNAATRQIPLLGPVGGKRRVMDKLRSHHPRTKKQTICERTPLFRCTKNNMVLVMS